MALKRKKSTVIKKLQGEKRPCRLNPNEPQPTVGIIKRVTETANLKKLRKEYLNYFEDILTRMKVLTEADSKQLEIYCKACADEVYYTNILDKEGYFIEVLRGIDTTTGDEIKETKTHPATVRLEKTRDAINRYGAVLGLTPSARAGLQIISGSKKGEFGKFIKGNKK